MGGPTGYEFAKVTETQKTTKLVAHKLTNLTSAKMILE